MCLLLLIDSELSRAWHLFPASKMTHRGLSVTSLGFRSNSGEESGLGESEYGLPPAQQSRSAADRKLKWVCFTELKGFSSNKNASFSSEDHAAAH